VTTADGMFVDLLVPVAINNFNVSSRSLYAVVRPSVCPSITFVRPTQPVEIFGRMKLASLAILVLVLSTTYAGIELHVAYYQIIIIITNLFVEDAV